MKSYRDYIYNNYSDVLKKRKVLNNSEKEEAAINKYFKRNYLPHFPKNRDCKILDLGCGLGYYMKACKKFGYENVMGVDMSQSNVEYCRQCGMMCELGDALSYLRSSGGGYDIIIFNDVIEHLTKEELFPVLLEIKSALKSGGKLIIKTYNLANPITSISGRYFDMTHEIGFNEASMYQVLNAIDFKNIKIKGADIFVIGVPFIYVLKLYTIIQNTFWYLQSCVYGRNSITIFSKNLIAIAKKE